MMNLADIFANIQAGQGGMTLPGMPSMRRPGLTGGPMARPYPGQNTMLPLTGGLMPRQFPQPQGLFGFGGPMPGRIK